MRTSLLAVLFLAAPLLAQDVPARPAAGSFKVTFDAALQATPYTGRVCVTLSKRADTEPRRGLSDWGSKNPVFAVDAKDVAPGGTVVFDETAVGFPGPLNGIEAGDYTAQAVARRNLDSPFPGNGAGDLYSEPVAVSVKPGDAGVVELKLSKVAAEEPFKETDRIKEVSFISPLLSQFYGKETRARAAVILPTNWKDVAGLRHPTLYFIGGYGTTHAFANQLLTRLPKSAGEVMVVVLDSMGPLGHTYFVDSPNNGPRGKSLVEEIIPAVESRFHGAMTADIRWVSGIKCGGWASLWLTATYPESFGNCWAFCPDSVDFSDFQRIDLYADGANLYKDAGGARRPYQHNGREVTAWFDDVCRQEWVAGGGGQIQSFEAAFGPKGDNGRPRPLFDRATGAVDPETAKVWRAHDLRMVFEKDWSTLGPKLENKVHVYTGEFDNFYLEGSCRKLAASLKERGSGIDVHIVPGAGHAPPQIAWGAMFQILRDRAAGSSNLPSIEPPH